ncbi:MAG: ABC transporter ATP-binding protein [Cyanobacteriota bacterium]
MSESDVVIRVEGLGKKYSLHHEQGERYTALRDVVARQAKAAGRLLNPFTLAGQLRKAQRQAAQERAEREEEFWALKDVSFEIRRGERVGIIGRNGAGKSTLLKILSRITEPTTGRVEIRGRVASLLEVGTGFHPELTGRENIYLNGAILGMTRREIRSKFDEIVDFAEVEKFLDTPVKRYSSGMYVRLAFAVAAHLDPEILVVDEVLAVGDASFQNKCLGKMKSASTVEGRTVLFVSHNLGATRSLCSKAILMNLGRIRDSGAPERVIESYLSSTQGLTGKAEYEINANKKAQVLTVFLRNENNMPTNEFRLGSEVTAEIHFVLNENIKGCHIACIVTNGEGVHLFSTCDTDTKPELFQVREKGEYAAKVRLPTTLLNVGIYNLAFGIGIPGIESFDRQDGLSFRLYDVEGVGSMKECGGRAGLLLVQAQWFYLS